jgi:hypothetical protein
MTIHTLPALGPAAAFSQSASRGRANPALLIAAALYIAVLIAEAVFIARAAPSLPDIGSYYAVVP